jgi:hypothetical protein
MGVTAIALAMAVPGAVALGTANPAKAWQERERADRPVRGTYRTSWGPARVSDAPRGNRVSIAFDDGSYISIEPPAGGPAGRLIGYWHRPRRDGRDPSGIERWATRCASGTPQHPIASRDPRSPWWGTVLLTVAPDGQLTGQFNSCNGLPHRPDADRVGLRAWLVEAARPVSPFTKAPLTRNPATIETLMRATQSQCAGSTLAVAVPSGCRMIQGQHYYLRLLRPVPAGQGRILFRPLRPDSAAVLQAISRRGPLPVRSDVPAVSHYYSAPRPLARGHQIDVNYMTGLCRSDLWAISLIDGGGRQHDDIGLLVMPCGPREGIFAEDPLAK